jgi:hypothetical protein
MREAEVSQFDAPTVSPVKESKPVVTFKEATFKPIELKAEPEES